MYVKYIKCWCKTPRIRKMIDGNDASKFLNRDWMRLCQWSWKLCSIWIWIEYCCKLQHTARPTSKMMSLYILNCVPQNVWQQNCLSMGLICIMRIRFIYLQTIAQLILHTIAIIFGCFIVFHFIRARFLFFYHTRLIIKKIQWYDIDGILHISNISHSFSCLWLN